jgi:hypothetical protein
MMMEIGQKNLFIIICMPTYFMLDKYVALFRTRGLFHVYKKKKKKGNWIYFNAVQKKKIYTLGKKYYEYYGKGFPRSRLKGKFSGVYTVDEQSYRDKKLKALNSKSNTTKKEKYMEERDIAIYTIYKNFSLIPQQISKLFEMEGLKLARRTIADIIKKIEIKKGTYIETTKGEQEQNLPEL